MASPNTPVRLPYKSQQSIIEYANQAFQLLHNQWNFREQLRQVDLAYIRENDFTKNNQAAKIANRYGDADRFQNITVPVVMPAVEAATTYQASVFLTGYPLFGVVSSPEYEDEALQLETVIANQSLRGGWVRELMMNFRDGFKYNLGCIEVAWDRVVTPTFETDLSFSSTQGKPKEVIWEGNCIRRCNLYNTFWDSRVTPTEVHSKGEFAGYTKLYSRTGLKQLIQELPDVIIENVKAAFESGLGATGTVTSSIDTYYMPQINPEATLNRNAKAEMDWMQWANLSASEKNIQYKNIYEVTTLYARIIPSDFSIIVPSSNTPQIWKLVIVNHSVVISAERQTNAHNYLPMLFSQPLEDGLDYQTKSLATNVKPIQEFVSAMSNSVIAARRRAISDRTLYDPSRISEAHINSPNPSAKIPVRPAAYGKNISESVHAFPFRDDQSGTVLQEMPIYLQMGNMIAGQNAAKQGQFVKGNKTRDEYQSVMSNANGRDQMVAMLYEAQLFTPLKEILKINILQYQGGTSIYNKEAKKVINIDPIKLRTAVMEFKISDGLTPTDKLISSDTLQVGLQVLGSSPAISQQYNVGKLFSYLMKTQGADVAAFEKSPEQLAYEQAVQQWQAAVQQITLQLKGLDPQAIQQVLKSLPPQPLPAQYNYVPAQGAGTDTSQQVKVSSNVNNITNNITDNRGV